VRLPTRLSILSQSPRIPWHKFSTVLCEIFHVFVCVREEDGGREREKDSFMIYSFKAKIWLINLYPQNLVRAWSRVVTQIFAE
jgi:hypothetical protein